jgi:excisionase family DNA binding protein
MLSEILTPQEVAEYLRVDIQTVYRLAKSGKLPAFKAGKSWRFHRMDVERYVTYKYKTFGPDGARPNLFRETVLDKYKGDPDPSKGSEHIYYILDEPFSGKLGLRELYYKWKQGEIKAEENFVEVAYTKVRIDMSRYSEPTDWIIAVVIQPKEYEKIMSSSEEYKHWENHRIHKAT